MSEPPASSDELDRLEATIDRWLSSQMDENPAVSAVERHGPGSRRWLVRLDGEEKDVFTVRFQLRQRTLHYETHFMPAPEENKAELYEHVLRRNQGLYGGAFVIGDEDALYLQGHLDRSMIVDHELDRVLGSLYAWVEQYFRPAMRIGFASRFKG